MRAPAESGCRSLGPAPASESGRRPLRWFVDFPDADPIEMDLRQLVRGFDAERIDADTLLWRTGMPGWTRLRDVPELADFLLGEVSPADEPFPEVADTPVSWPLSETRPALPPPSSAPGVAPEPAPEPRDESPRAVLIALGAVLSLRASIQAWREKK